jgi:hypothetical protein
MAFGVIYERYDEIDIKAVHLFFSTRVLNVILERWITANDAHFHSFITSNSSTLNISQNLIFLNDWTRRFVWPISRRDPIRISVGLPALLTSISRFYLVSSGKCRYSAFQKATIATFRFVTFSPIHDHLHISYALQSLNNLRINRPMNRAVVNMCLVRRSLALSNPFNICCAFFCDYGVFSMYMKVQIYKGKVKVKLSLVIN